ncbi:MAG TPA: hypothetical protein ENL34_06425 [Chloroflexi bacterium]|nr:hypothetical protein [Chloroflexota bacterium]
MPGKDDCRPVSGRGTRGADSDECRRIPLHRPKRQAITPYAMCTYLGHSRFDTTARYSQPTEDNLAAAAERLR